MIHADLLDRLREENRKLQLSLDKAMAIVRSKAPKIKSELDILHELEQVELSHDVAYVAKLREAVILERAKRHFYSATAFDGDYFEYYDEYHEKWLHQAESELRAEGVIE